MNHCTREQLIAFERRIADLWEAGELPYLIHLSGGNEDQLIEIFREIQPGDWVFSTHRNHYHYLLAGGSPVTLERLIREGRSMFVFGQCAVGFQPTDLRPPEYVPPAQDRGLQTHGTLDPRLQCHFLSSSVLAGTCPIAAGVAWEIKRRCHEYGLNPKLETRNSKQGERVWCFLGDGAEDEGHFYEAVRFVEGHGLPCTFIIEDNDRSVSTSKAARRGTGLNAKLETRNSPHLRRYDYVPTWPHAGSGCRHHITFRPRPAPVWT